MKTAIFLIEKAVYFTIFFALMLPVVVVALLVAEVMVPQSPLPAAKLEQLGIR